MNHTTERRQRICFVATIPFAINVFLRAHVEVLMRTYDVTLVTNGSVKELAASLQGGVCLIPVRIERKVSLKNDVLALVKLWRLFRTARFDIVHSITPKAGLLSMIAARGACIRYRLHTFTGQVWATKKGVQRFALRMLDRFLAMNATRVFADSHSQRRFLIDNNVVSPSKIEVLADGSFVGVDTRRFCASPSARSTVRAEFGIAEDAIVYLFLGRLNRDKGILDLFKAFATAADDDCNIHLMVVGPDESGIDLEYLDLSRQHPARLHRAGFSDYPERYMSAADVFCLPSYREGFGSVLVEAAAVGLPAIASRIYGITDAVEDGVTGILHEAGAPSEIAAAMLLFARDVGLRRTMGMAARERALTRFSELRLTTAFADLYHSMLSGPAAPC
jgi:glycosyltransferase involved in cell wall biosynthesis